MRCVLFVILTIAVGCGRNLLQARQTRMRTGTHPPRRERRSRRTRRRSTPKRAFMPRSWSSNTATLTGSCSTASLWGTQFNDKFRRHYADDLGLIVPGCPWDIITAAGANAVYNPRLDPLTYYHRTGPIGAMFRELRARKKGADAKAPVGILSLGAGTEAAYALPGQTITYYESDPALKRLVADSDKYFTFISDARKRGATIDIRIGKPREKLAEDKERKYPLLIVDLAAESFPIPREIDDP